jgi:hypothetical protein
MRWQTKIEEIPSGATKEQIETAMDNITKQGWELVLIQQINSSHYAVFKRRITI